MRRTLLVVASFGLAAAARASGWQVVELPAPPSGWTGVSPRAINASEQIAGEYRIAGDWSFSAVVSCVTNQWGTFCTYERHPFLWKDGEMLDLGTLGGPDGTARGVNSLGEVVGDSTTAEQPYCRVEGGLQYCVYRTHAFVWSDGAMVDLGAPGLTSYATGVNERGDIAGVAEATPRVYRPVTWRRR